MAVRLVLFACIALVSAAPEAQVRRFQSISAVDGGLAGPIADRDRFGVSAAPLGDLDGDGTVELAVGAYGDRDGRGAVWMLSLRPDGTVARDHAIRLDVLMPGDRFGTSVATVGDLDGDGLPELAVGADAADDGGPNRGAVWILFLDADGMVRQQQRISATAGGLSDPPADGDLFGHAVAGIGDLDGDGTPDLAVGGDDADDGGPNRGAVWVLALAPDGTVRRTQRISATAGGFAGALDDGDLFGQAVAGVGDLDADGVPDLAVAATLDDDGGDGRGAVWILFLARGGTVRRHQKISATAGGFGGALDDRDLFGSSLVAPGDLDGDGVPDLVVGANQDDDGGPDRGSGWVLFLTRAGTVRQHQKISAAAGGATGPFHDGDQWNPTASLGDLDGGGVALVFGSRLADAGGDTRGAARILFTGYAVDAEPPPPSVRLSAPAPSPTRHATEVMFELAAPGAVSLRIVDVLGRERAVLIDGDRPAGVHRVSVAVAQWPAGVYVVHLRTAAGQASRSFVVVR